MYLSLNDQVNALSSFEEAIKYNPRNLFSLTSLSRLLKETGDYPRALQYADRAFEIEPDKIRTKLKEGIKLLIEKQNSF